MVNPTIEEAGHYNPQAGKCPVCSGWWGLHSIEEENDHAIKILDWLEKNEKAQKIFGKDGVLSILYNNGKTLRKYYKNYHKPARDMPAAGIMLTFVLNLGKIKGAFTVKEIREYFKNIPPMKAHKDWLTKEQRRELQIEIEKKNRREIKRDRELVEFMRKMKYGK